MRWKSLLTCCKASMCSTAQSPRARKAFSRACAARTCPAPDVADSNNTRGFVFICWEFLRRQAPSGGLALARGDFLQNASRNFLQIPEPCQVILKIVIQELRVLRAQLRPQNHVSQFYGMRSEEHTSELQSQSNLVCRLLLEKKKKSRHSHLCY